jgi:hypothetical protein
MEYKLVYFEGYPEGSWGIQGTEPDGKVWGIPADESNAMYQQYLIDTDGGLPIPKAAK